MKKCEHNFHHAVIYDEWTSRLIGRVHKDTKVLIYCTKCAKVRNIRILDVLSKSRRRRNEMVIFECQICGKTYVEGSLISGDRKREGRIKGICKTCSLGESLKIRFVESIKI